MPPEKRMEKMVEYLKSELDLTDAQYKQLQSVKENILQRYKSIKKPPFWFRDDFLSQLEKGTIDKEQVKKEVKEFHNVMLENRLKDIDDISSFFNTLTTDQRKKLADLVREHREHFKKHHMQ
jgi:Spy/CpxP family protein refolding chaperone